MTPARPCLTCGTLTTATRCARCASDRDSIYRGAYRARAAEVRATATACWLCGQGPRLDDPWTADHVVPHHAGSPLRAAHRSCNSARGDRA
jgi:5-methylcytosine-specific restriction endonuclease McrA